MTAQLETPGGAIFSHIDVPSEAHVTILDACLIRGWACAVQGLTGVDILVDGALVHQFLPDGIRPDVAALHPSIPESLRSGFDVTVDLGPLPQGVHELQIVIRDGAGHQLHHHRVLQVFANPYHRVLMETQLRGPEREALIASIAAAGLPPRFELWVDARAGDDIDSTLRSIAAQTYPRWTCHIVGTGVRGTSPAGRSMPIEEARWHASFSDAIGSEGDDADYLAFLLHSEILLPDALLHVAARLEDSPAEVVYSDHDLVAPTGVHADPVHAPDWSPEHLYSRNYVGGIFFVRRDALRKQGLNPNDPAWRYDALLRITERAARVGHVPRVLWSSPAPETDPTVLTDGEKHAVEAALHRRGMKADVIALPGAPVHRVRRHSASTPKVSIIVPTTGRLNLVQPLVESLQAHTSYPRYELVFLDNGHGRHPDGIAYLRSRGLRVIARDEPFNWARLNNFGARESDGELLLFLNDDIEAVDPGWLGELVTQALVPDVGAVGALLLYPDGLIQHAGVFLVDHGGGARHYLQFLDPTRATYQHLAHATREVSAVTGACFMVRREVFEELGGFDEAFRVAFNDVDFCLRSSERGYRTIWTPHCRLLHHESVSRKGGDISDDERRVWDRWGARLLAGDAHHNPNLAKDRADCSIDTSVLSRRPLATDRPREGPGVNLIGYIRAEMGVGEAARGLARAMDATDTPFVIIDYEYGNPARKGDATWIHRIVEEPAYDVNILVVNADLTPEACGRLGAALFEDRYTIAYWHWELPELPDRWRPAFDCVDEVWVSSEFVRKAVADKSRVPVTRVPLSVEKGPGPYYERPFFDLPPAPFLFLSMYDTQSVMERKNPEGAIAAFRDAFAPTDPAVGLVLKVNNFDEKEGTKLRALMGHHKNIHLIDRTLSRHEVDSLMNCCDCFVSLHRSEGFGLPMAEAMALGKPVIATYWSGNVDFMDETCAACVDYELRQLGRDYGPYEAHQHWAEPNLETATGWMRTLAADPATARRIGAAGRKRIDEALSNRVVGERIRARLAEIHEILATTPRTRRVTPVTGSNLGRDGLKEQRMRTPGANKIATATQVDSTFAATAAETLTKLTAAMFEPGARIVHAGAAGCGSLLEQLHARGCHVTILAAADEVVPDDLAVRCDRVLRGDVGAADLGQLLGNERFDAAIVSEWLTRADEPERLLKSITTFLDEAGYVVAAVPNVAHGTVRLALLAGTLPPNGSSPLEPAARRLYTRATLETLFETCGLALGHVDRVETPIDAGALPRPTPIPADELLASLAADEDATTSHFVALAFPLPAPQLTVFKDKIRGLVRRCEVADQQIRRLTRAASERESEMAACRRNLALRDQAIDTARDRSVRQQDVIDALHAQLQERRADAGERQAASDALQAARELQAALAGETATVAQLRAELDGFRRLGGDAAAVQADMESLREALRVSQAQMWVLRESFSWRITAPLRALVRRLGGNTTDAALGLRS